MQISLFKKLNYIYLILVLATNFVANTQEVRVIDNKGTLENIRNNQVTTSATAPIDPLEGDVWFDISGTTSVTNTYNGTEWIPNSVNVFTGAFTITVAGTTSVTNLPFQPTQVTFVAHANVESLDINADNGVGNNARGIYNSFGTMNGFARQNTDNTITQQVIYVGGHGNSINDISRFSSSANCIGIRYGDQNGTNLGIIRGALTGFTANGFDINVTYTNGTVTSNGTNTNLVLRVLPTDVLQEDVVVLFTAYR